MDLRMSESPLDRIPAYNQGLDRAVLVHEGEEPSPALAATGIVDPIAIPVALDEEIDLAGGILGDGITPNLITVLETEQHDEFGSRPYDPPDKAPSQPDAGRPDDPVATTMPEAFGMRSFAPMGRLGDTRSGRFGYPPTVCPPSPWRPVAARSPHTWPARHFVQ